MKFNKPVHHFQQQRQFGSVQVLACDLGQQHAAAFMTEQHRNLRAGHKGQQSPFMSEKMWDHLQPYGLAFDRQAPETGKIPRAYLRRWRCRSNPALGQYGIRPGKVGRGAGRTRKGVSARVVIEDPGPLPSRAHWLRNFGEICHSAAMGLFQFGVEQPQHDNVNAMMITYRPDNRFNVWPPWRRNGHGRQESHRVAFGRHQHQLCGSWLNHCHRLS